MPILSIIEMLRKVDNERMQSETSFDPNACMSESAWKAAEGDFAVLLNPSHISPMFLIVQAFHFVPEAAMFSLTCEEEEERSLPPKHKEEPANMHSEFKRPMLNDDNVEYLESVFKNVKYPSDSVIEYLADDLVVPMTTIKVINYYFYF